MVGDKAVISVRALNGTPAGEHNLPGIGVITISVDDAYQIKRRGSQVVRILCVERVPVERWRVVEYGTPHFKA